MRRLLWLLPMTLVACSGGSVSAGCSAAGGGAPAAALVALIATLAALRLARSG